MNVLNIEHVSKGYGEKIIFDDVSYGIQNRDKIGIVGINGTGKTSLLRIIAGLEEPDEGMVVRQRGLKLASLPQNPEYPQGVTALDYVRQGEAPGGRNEKSDAQAMLNQLGITEHDELLDILSGGQKKRAALARTLLTPADVLLLDEPTNHLDGGMIQWLEEYLIRYRGVIVMVTHDRYFLDRVSNRILYVSGGKLYGYTANYTKFLEMKAEREEMELASQRKKKSVLRMELEWAKRGCRARSTKQRARLERLEALKNSAAPPDVQNVEMDSVSVRMGKKTIQLKNVSKRYGGKCIVRDFTYIVLRNERLGIIGPNGCGKTTLLKMIAGAVEPDSGTVETGETIKIGYFAQEDEKMPPGQRVIDYIRDVAEYIPVREGKISASMLLERFLFDPDMQYTPIGKLSGGERRRLYLLKVLAQGCNVLILDEPSNDLDIPTLTILEDFLESFSGIAITVSHDRYFLDNVVDRILEFTGEGQLKQYEGGYTDYLEAKLRGTDAGEHRDKTAARCAGGKSSGRQWKENQPVKLKFSYREQKEYETIDSDIAALESAIEGIGKEMELNATNSVKLNELTKEQEKLEQDLEEKMERWVYLNDLAERIEEQG